MLRNQSMLGRCQVSDVGVGDYYQELSSIVSGAPMKRRLPALRYFEQIRPKPGSGSGPNCRLSDLKCKESSLAERISAFFDVYTKLNELNELREKGILTDAEFDSEKKKLVDGEQMIRP